MTSAQSFFPLHYLFLPQRLGVSTSSSTIWFQPTLICFQLLMMKFQTQWSSVTLTVTLVVIAKSDSHFSILMFESCWYNGGIYSLGVTKDHLEEEEVGRNRQAASSVRNEPSQIRDMSQNQWRILLFLVLISPCTLPKESRSNSWPTSDLPDVWCQISIRLLVFQKPPVPLPPHPTTVKENSFSYQPVLIYRTIIWTGSQVRKVDIVLAFSISLSPHAWPPLACLVYCCNIFSFRQSDASKMASIHGQECLCGSCRVQKGESNVVQEHGEPFWKDRPGPGDWLTDCDPGYSLGTARCPWDLSAALLGFGSVTSTICQETCITQGPWNPQLFSRLWMTPDTNMFENCYLTLKINICFKVLKLLIVL